jgi:hypothetical protein
MTGTDPTTSIYSASVVIFYCATGSLAHIENKNILFYFESCSFKLVPGANPTTSKIHNYSSSVVAGQSVFSKWQKIFLLSKPIRLLAAL